MGKGFEYQLTAKAKTLITFSQLLKSDVDCVLHLYKVLQDAEEKDIKKYHTNRLQSLLFQSQPLPPFNCLSSFPVDRNLNEWGIKINKGTDRMDHLDMIKMIGGSSKESESPYHRFIVTMNQHDWINGSLLTELDGNTILVKKEPPSPTLRQKVMTIEYKTIVDESDDILYNIFGNYSANEHSFLIVEQEIIRYNTSRHHYSRYI